jgi:hypothetical protein
MQILVCNLFFSLNVVYLAFNVHINQHVDRWEDTLLYKREILRFHLMFLEYKTIWHVPPKETILSEERYHEFLIVKESADSVQKSVLFHTCMSLYCNLRKKRYM